MTLPEKDGIPIVYAANRKQWRSWLKKNHEKEAAVWLIFYHKKSSTPSVYYPEAVEEALCFGWIDSKANKRDGESSYQYFARRKAKSKWSRLNRERVKKMTDAGLMMPAGQKMIDIAKETGTWEILEEVQRSVIPDDLMELLKKNKKAKKFFDAFPPSSKRIILEWIQNAKREDTRKKRIEQTVEMAAQNLRANHYRQ